MTLQAALLSERWFVRRSWELTFEPFAYRWMHSKLEQAPRGELFNTRYIERQFSPFDVLAHDWELVE
jgi:hypothetical protein